MNRLYLKNPDLGIETVMIEADRCILRPFSLDLVDIADLQQAFCSANEHFYISPHLPTVEEERAFVLGIIEDRKRDESFECFMFDKLSGKHLGAVGVSRLTGDEPNIGLWIRTEYHGKWYGTEVYAAMIEWCRRETSLSFLKHSASPENTASIRLAKKFGGVLQDEWTERNFLKYYISL